MPKLKIDKNVPLSRSSSGTPKYPWSDMQVGDSFFIPQISQRTRGGLYTCAQRAAAIKITVRSVTENGVEGVRVWRIADEKPPQKIRAA